MCKKGRLPVKAASLEYVDMDQANKVCKGIPNGGALFGAVSGTRKGDPGKVGVKTYRGSPFSIVGIRIRNKIAFFYTLVITFGLHFGKSIL